MDATHDGDSPIAERRMEGVRLLEMGVPKADVARRLILSRQSVCRWAKRLAEHDVRAPKSPGRPRWLDSAQCATLCAILGDDALAEGFTSPQWTVKRARTLIEREFGVAYSKTDGWELLRTLGVSLQRTDRHSSIAR
ncbi:transposase [Burkholderia thailandensis]|uniref:helix-turn-helix domain-containing protein n=1 Tax=Burkholderia thailandensis TaxID=57975 RepID=UPI00148ED814|nr:helix-turn-helix domain-containing protein [Burkholderia thailandensis]NOK45531.1 transposase [Burkholderia thailandensis]NOK47239.1 helix-turn-helix domain-containing protein [Burkholderia thailandensis]